MRKLLTISDTAAGSAIAHLVVNPSVDDQPLNLNDSTRSSIISSCHITPSAKQSNIRNSRLHRLSVTCRFPHMQNFAFTHIPQNLVMSPFKFQEGNLPHVLFPFFHKFIIVFDRCLSTGVLRFPSHLYCFMYACMRRLGQTSGCQAMCEYFFRARSS